MYLTWCTPPPDININAGARIPFRFSPVVFRVDCALWCLSARDHKHHTHTWVSGTSQSNQVGGMSGGVVNAVVWRNVVPLMLSLLCCVVWCSGSIKAVGSLHSPCQPSTDLRPSLVFGPCGHGRTKTKRTDGHTASYAEAGKKK